MSKKIVNVRVKPENYIKLKHISIDKSSSVTSIVEKLIDDYLNLSTDKNIGVASE
jgi:hypothetical protein